MSTDNHPMSAPEARTHPSSDLADAGATSQQLDYERVSSSVSHLASLPGFVCMGPAPGQERLSGLTWLSALPDSETDPQLGLEANVERLRLRRCTLTGTGIAGDATLPTVIGALHYEAAYLLIGKLSRLSRKRPHRDAPPYAGSCPIQAALYTWSLECDHDHKQAFLKFHPQCPAETRSRVFAALNSVDAPQQQVRVGRFQPLQGEEDYKASVQRIRRYIEAGDCYQTNLSQQFEAPILGPGWPAYQALSRLFPTPQSAFLAQGESELLSLSPEIFLNIRNRIVKTRPIKGTRPRGRTVEEDAHLAEILANSEKDRAENLMIVDLLRNDLGRLCKTGSVRVQDLFKLESYANVHHLVSTVEGELEEGVDSLDLLLGCFPGGSITGAPKIRAMEIIAELEPHRRGPYCGSIFRWDRDDSLWSNIAIRTLWRKDNRIRCCGGGGIVHDSDPAAEYAETLTKIRLLMDTLENLGTPQKTQP